MRIRKRILFLTLLILSVVIVSAPKIAFADEVSILDEGNQDITFTLVKPSNSQQSENGQAGSSSSGNFLSDHLPQLNEKSGLVLLVIFGLGIAGGSVYYIRRRRRDEKMKLNKVLFTTVILAGFILLSPESYASEAQQSNKTSSIEIEIVPKTLYLSTITPPTFGEYKISNDGITLNADSDLVINVEDKRESVKSPWVLYYQVGTFTNETGDPIPNQQVTVGEGKLMAQNTDLSNTDYESYKINADISTMTPIVKTSVISNNENYEYRVPKENISITLSGEMQPGTYTGVQSVYLASVPDSN